MPASGNGSSSLPGCSKEEWRKIVRLGARMWDLSCGEMRGSLGHTDGLLPLLCSLAAAFHVGRAELLQWINGLLDLRYTKVEQCANGAAYCMILNATFQVMVFSSSPWQSHPPSCPRLQRGGH